MRTWDALFFISICIEIFTLEVFKKGLLRSGTGLLNTLQECAAECDRMRDSPARGADGCFAFAFRR